jgi:hypothetical protein
MTDVAEHPILGKSLPECGDEHGRIYTRTVVLWAIGITIDPDLLWENVEVRCGQDERLVKHDVDIGAPPGKGERPAPNPIRPRPSAGMTKTVPCRQPVVRMMTSATKRRGMLRKRLRRAQTFRSVLSMDVEYNGYMPNLKISARNTIQVTGAQDMQILGDIFRHLVSGAALRLTRSVADDVPGKGNPRASTTGWTPSRFRR